jgi:hypothetical protein
MQAVNDEIIMQQKGYAEMASKMEEQAYVRAQREWDHFF